MRHEGTGHEITGHEASSDIPWNRLRFLFSSNLREGIPQKIFSDSIDYRSPIDFRESDRFRTFLRISSAISEESSLIGKRNESSRRKRNPQKISDSSANKRRCDGRRRKAAFLGLAGGERSKGPMKGVGEGSKGPTKAVGRVDDPRQGPSRVCSSPYATRVCGESDVFSSAFAFVASASRGKRFERLLARRGERLAGAGMRFA